MKKKIVRLPPPLSSCSFDSLDDVSCDECLSEFIVLEYDIYWNHIEHTFRHPNSLDECLNIGRPYEEEEKSD